MRGFRTIDLRDDFEVLAAERGTPEGQRFAQVTAFDPSGKFLAIAIDTRVAVHEIATGVRVEEYALAEGLGADSDGVEAEVWASRIAMSADGRLIVGVEIAREDRGWQHGMIEVFDRRSGALRFRRCTRGGRGALHESKWSWRGEDRSFRTRDGCSAWALTSDGGYLAIGEFDGSLQLVDALSGEEIRRTEGPSEHERQERIHEDNPRPVRGLAFDRRGRVIGAARWISQGGMAAFQLETFDVDTSLSLTGSVRFYRDGRFELAGGGRELDRVSGIDVCMACTGTSMLVGTDDGPTNSMVVVFTDTRQIYRPLSLMEYRVTDVSMDAELVLCSIVGGSPYQHGRGAPPFRLARMSQGSWEGLYIPALDTPEATGVIAGDAGAAYVRDDGHAYTRAAQGPGPGLGPGEPSPQKRFHGGALSRDGSMIAVALDGCVEVGPVMRRRLPAISS